MGPPQATFRRQARYLVCQPSNFLTSFKPDIYTFQALSSFNLDRPVSHNRRTDVEHPEHSHPLITLDRPVKPPSVTKDLPNINLDRPARVQKVTTAQQNLELQHPVDNHSSINLDRPSRPPAAHALLHLDRPAGPPAVSTDKKRISLEGPVSPDLNFERPAISTLNLDRPGRKRPPIDFDLTLRQPATSQNVHNLDRPHRPP